MMKQTLLKTIALGLIAMVGVNAWAQTNLLSAEGISVSWTPKDGNATPLTPSEGTISFKPGNTNDFSLSLSFTGVSINASNAYFIIQASSGALGSATKKIRNLKIDDKTFDSSNNLDLSQRAVTLSETAYQVNAMTPLGKLEAGTTKIFDYYYSKIDGTMTLKGISFDLRAASADEITIHKIYLCNITEITTLYSKKVQFVKGNTDYPRIDVKGDNFANAISVVDNGAITFSSPENAVVVFKSLGTLASTTELDMRGLAISSGSPLKKETMGNLSAAKKVNLNVATYKYFPTKNQNVALVGDNVYNRYRHFQDGTAPNSSEIINAGNSSNTTYWYASCARTLVKGYNSMLLPFDVSYDDINSMGLTAYTYTSSAAGTVTFTKVESGTIDMHTPFVVKCDEEKGGLFQFPSNGAITNYNSGTPNSEDFKTTNYYPVGDTDCYFIGSYINEVPGTTTGKGWPAGMTSSTHTFYGINSVGTKFLKMKSDTKTTYYRAFLVIPASSPAPSLAFTDFENGTTDIKRIEDIDGMDVISDGAIYNLQGVRMNGDNLPRGIYVRNGKKFVVK